ncbi:P-loop containing nucleoside triphosphate hydrolase protein, partial [Rhodotorula sp. JG-1b]
QKLYASLLATADVFCATAVGSGASKVLNMVDFPIVLLDEAAMCTEPVSLIPLMKGAQHATLIGDHKQLPAVVTSKEARRERLHTSLFERLLQSGTVNSTLLDTQYRMRPAISSFPNDSFYQGALRDASILDGGANPTSSPTIEGEPFPVSFVAHSSPESTHRQSLLNRGESDLLITIVGDLLAANPDLVASDIGIISPYYAQMRLVSNSFSSGYASARLGQLLDPDRAASVVDVEVNTVDGFQGREKRVVLLSTVRSNKGGWIGFLNDKRRLNVALTRARDALIVVGNEQTLR